MKLLLPELKISPQYANEKVQVGKDHEKEQSGKKKIPTPKTEVGTYTMKTYRKPNEQLFSQ